MLNYFLSLNFLIIDTECGQVRNPNVDSLMIKGKNVNKGELPWHVAIYQISKKNELICGGSIVSPYAILTGIIIFSRVKEDRTRNILSLLLLFCYYSTIHKLIHFP